MFPPKKRLSIVFVTCCLIRLVPCTAEDPDISACGPDCQDRVTKGFHAAEQLERQGQFEAAAKRYGSLIAEEPRSITSLHAALRAGNALEQVNKFLEAAEFYQTAISIANARENEPSRSKALILKDYKRDAMYARAHALEEAQHCEEAVPQYREVVQFLVATDSSANMAQTNAILLQRAALGAGQCLEQTGNIAEAVALYEQAIAVGNARADTADGEKAIAILDAKRDALFKKADASQRLGQTENARSAIQQLKAEFPVSLAAVKAHVVEARLDNRNPAAAEFIVAQELTAQAILNQAIGLAESKAGGVDAIRGITCAVGRDGMITVQCKLKSGQGAETFWNLWIDDPAGKNLARLYGSGVSVRGRIGTTSMVTEKVAYLTGEWADLQIRITPATDQSEFLFKGESIGRLSHTSTGAGEVVGRIRLERVDNPAAVDGVLDIDELLVSSGSTSDGVPCITESFNYANGALNGVGGWSGGATTEIRIKDGALRIQGGAYEHSLQLLDQIIKNFPDSASALLALEKKGRLLGNLKRTDEARAALAAVVDSLRPTSPRSEFFQTTRVRLKRMVLEYLVEETRQKRHTSDQEWDKLRTLCSEIIEQDTRPDDRAQAWISIAQSFSWQRRYAECLRVSEDFLAQHDVKTFPSQTAWAQFFAGTSLQGLKQYPDALAYYRSLLARSDITSTSPLGQKLFPGLKYRIVSTLELTGVSTQEAQRTFEELVQAKTGSPP